MLLLITALLLLQEDPEPSTHLVGTAILKSGDKLNLVDLRIMGPDPFSFMLTRPGESEFLDLNRIVKIEQLQDSHQYAVVFETGDRLVGRIGTISFIGADPASQERVTVNLRRIERLHVIAGGVMRSCDNCSYEEKTPHPFCPVCGRELSFGPFEVDEPEAQPQPAVHRLRLDSRDPTSGIKQ